MEHTGERKRLVVWSGGGIAQAGAVAAFLGAAFRPAPDPAIVAITSLNGLRAFMASFANPAWTSIVAEIVPEFMRGRYFSARNISMGVATLIVTAFAGWIIHSGNTLDARTPTWGFNLVFFLAFGVGMFSTYFFSRIEEPPAKVTTGGSQRGPRSAPCAPPQHGVSGVCHQRLCLELLSLQLAGPFFNVYLVTNLGADATMVGIVTSISSLAALGGQLLFGRLMDRKGAIWVQLVTGFPIVVLPVMWMTYTDPWQVGVNNFFGGFLWAGYNLANFTLLLTLTPAAGRGRGRWRSIRPVCLPARCSAPWSAATWRTM